jgi:L-fucose isomerase
MTLIARDLMQGNPRLAELGFGEEALGHNAIAGGFQGQRHWTDHFPNGDFMEAILNSSFDWNGIRPPVIMATENDALNGACMLMGYLLTNTAQIFADVRTYWSPDAVKRVTGDEADRGRRQRVVTPHQFRFGHTRRHGPAGARRQAGD